MPRSGAFDPRLVEQACVRLKLEVVKAIWPRGGMHFDRGTPYDVAYTRLERAARCDRRANDCDRRAERRTSCSEHCITTAEACIAAVEDCIAGAEACVNGAERRIAPRVG